MAKVGIEDIRDLGNGVAELVCDGIDLVKGSYMKIFEVIADIKVIVKAAPAALPELKDLDADEAAELTKLAYVLVARIVEKVGK